MRVLTMLSTRREVALVSLMMLISSLIHAQTDLKFRRYGLSDGLPQATVECMLQDRQGFIWMGNTEWIVPI